MKIFIWENVEHLTTNWHNGGGLTVVAESLDAARELLRASVPEKCEAFTKDPNKTYDLFSSAMRCSSHCTQCGDDPEPVVIVFPDSGCC